ncbi:MAG: DUF3857 domain-containing protein [Bdellovibrionota bacterium]
MLKISLTALVLLSFTLPASARWIEPKEASHAINFSNLEVQVRKDGSHIDTLEQQVEILNDAGRDSEGMLRFTTTAQSSEIKIIQAATINGGTRMAVPESDIEIKPLASAGPGFDLFYQVTIAFPDVRIGSKLYIKYSVDIKEAPMPGFFSMNYPIGWNQYVQKASVRVVSELPIVSEVFDTSNSFSVSRTEKSLTVKTKRPVYRAITEEDSFLMNPRAVPWIGVTTAKSWSDFPPETVAAFETELAAKLPKKYEQIVAKAAREKSDIDQINAVTSGLADQVRYVGDWRPVKGLYHPRPLAKVSETGFGDCKDFSASAGSMLRKLGFEVHVALVGRGKDWITSPIQISAPYINHAILFVKKGSNEYWIDPTNLTSFAQGIYSDIENRPAIVLSPGAPFQKMIPSMNADTASIAIKSAFKMSPKGAIYVAGSFHLGGHGAVSMTGGQLSSTKQQLDYSLLKWITANTTDIKTWKMGNYDLRSRTVKDLKTEFEYERAWHPMVTSAGIGYLIPATPYLSYFRVRLDGRISDLFLDDPIRWSREFTFTGMKPIVSNDFSCEGQSKWGDFSRSMKRSGESFKVNDSFKLKVSHADVRDLATKEFKVFQEDFAKCMQEAVVVFE